MPKQNCEGPPETAAEMSRPCKCPVPCSEVVHTPSLSYSSLSEQKLRQLLINHRKMDVIKEDFYRALEVKEQVMPSIWYFTRLDD